MPILNDSGATCSCITEEQVVLIVNHTQHMVEKGLMTIEDYNYPLVQFYQYRHIAQLRGAEAEGKMPVEFAVVLRIEFIPEGASSGPVKDIYFKIFKRGTCGIVGAVLGWPTLDQPLTPGGEGLGWRNHLEGAEYQALHVTIPRLDDHRKAAYQASAARYVASGGQLMAVDDVTIDVVHAIGPSEAQMLRAAALMIQKTPVAQMDPIGLEFISLEPGDRAVLPIRWNKEGAKKVTHCSTHPDAPTGLTVLPGTVSYSHLTLPTIYSV